MIVITIITFLKDSLLLIILRFQEYYDDFSEAKDDIKKGKTRGIIYFKQNFSESLQARIEDANFATDADLLAGQIQVFLDMGGTFIFMYYVDCRAYHLINLRNFSNLLMVYVCVCVCTSKYIS